MGDDKKPDFHGVYDYYYGDKRIFEIASDTSSVQAYFEANGQDFISGLYGYIYFLEIVTINIISQLELLTPDTYSHETIAWGKQESAKKIQSLKSSNPFVNHIQTANQIRSSLSQLRAKDSLSSDELKAVNSAISQLQTLLSNVESLIDSLYAKTRDNSDEILERRFITQIIVGCYNYIEHCPPPVIDLDSDWVPSEPLYPGSLHSTYLVTNEARRNYVLIDERLAKHNDSYLLGYKCTLAYLYYHLDKEAFSKVSEKFLTSKTWHELHKAGMTYPDHLPNMNFMSHIFTTTQKNSQEFPTYPKSIATVDELQSVFRGRSIKVVSDKFDPEQPEDQTLCFYLLFGGVHLHDAGLRDPMEVIEFKQQSKDKTWQDYAYAFYVPVGGSLGLWDASHWVIIDRVESTSDWESFSRFKAQLDSFLKEFGASAHFASIEIDRKLFVDYCRANDKMMKWSNVQTEQLEASRGLLTEFLAGLYLIKKYNAQLQDVRKTIPNTDIDVLASNDSEIFIVQSKPELSAKEKFLNSIIANFNEAEKHTKTDGKKFHRILFLMRHRKRYLSAKQQKFVSFAGIELNLSTKQGISVVYYDELKDILEKEGNHDLVRSVENIF